MIIALKSLKKYMKYIENMFESNITNGLIEDLNNKKSNSSPTYRSRGLLARYY